MCTKISLKRRWIQKLVFEDGGVQNISRIKINRTLIILMFLCIRQEKTPKGCKKKKKFTEEKDKLSRKEVL